MLEVLHLHDSTEMRSSTHDSHDRYGSNTCTKYIHVDKSGNMRIHFFATKRK